METRARKYRPDLRSSIREGAGRLQKQSKRCKENHKCDRSFTKSKKKKKKKKLQIGFSEILKIYV